MTALLAEGRLSRDKMKEVGLVPVLVEYLIHPHELLCRSMLVDPAELALSVSLLPHTYLYNYILNERGNNNNNII